MRSALLRIVVPVALLAGLVPRAASAATPADVEKALGRAKAFLYAQQVNGNWEKAQARIKSSNGQEVTGSQFGGLTGLAVLALVSAGENPQGEKLAPAVEFLKKADLVGTYALGVRCQVTLMLPQTPETKALMRKDLQRLLGLMKTKGKAQGFYDYDADGGATTYSLSRSQYAVLGVWAAAQSGQEVSRAYWSTVENAWVAHQDRSGGWNYQRGGRKDYPLTPGMTGVGVATLFITQDQLHAAQGVDCKGGARRAGAIERGIDWMTEHFDAVASDEHSARDFPYATLYAVERIGVAGGLKYFGDVDWYRKGADFLLAEQRKDGSWYGGSTFIGTLPDTCFGVIFLARGRAPVAFNKLNWQGGEQVAAGNWNQRPRDVANLTRWVGRSMERDLNWQIVNLDSPLRDLHDAPILYMSGSEAVKLDDDGHKGKLRQYVQGGGMILAHADCGGRAFANTARKLGVELFDGYEFRELPADHPIYASPYPRAKWKTKPSVLGLSNGVRELVLLVPQSDPGKTWQLNVVGGKEELWQLAANVLSYASSGRDLRYKGDTHVVEDAPDAKPSKIVRVARLSYKGNWDPEPGGWRRLRNLLRKGDGVDLVVEPVALGSGKLEGAQVAHLTGTSKLKLDAAARAQLKRFIGGGGTLVVDAAGGAEAFASSVEADLPALAGGGKPETLPGSHAIYAGKEPLRVAYLPSARKAVGKSDAPRVKAVSVRGRAAVLYSREDLSAGLVGHSVGGVFGYTPAAATELMRRIVLNTAGPGPTKPASKPRELGASAKPGVGLN